MPAKNDFHIWIKNLRTNEEAGFMLAAWDKPFTIQGMDNTATRIADWEIRYSDFTNTRVFAQSEWDEGISKFWEPKMVFSTIFPSHKYGDQKNILISWAGQEFTIGSAVDVFKNFPLPVTGISSVAKGASNGHIVVGTKWVPQIWITTDYGNSWSLEADLSTNPYFTGVDEITDIKVITNQKLFSTSGWSYISSASTYMPTGIYFIAYDNTLGQGIVGKKYYTPTVTNQSFTMVGDLYISKWDGAAIRNMNYYACGWYVWAIVGSTTLDMSSKSVTGAGWEYCTYTWSLPNSIAVGQLVSINGAGSYRITGISATSIQIQGATLWSGSSFTLQALIGKKMAFRDISQASYSLSSSQSYCWLVGVAFDFQGKRWRVVAQYDQQIAYGIWAHITSNISDINLSKSVVIEFDTLAEMNTFIAEGSVNISATSHIWNSNKASYIGKKFFYLEGSWWEYLYVQRKDGRGFIDLTFFNAAAGSPISTTAWAQWWYDYSMVYAVQTTDQWNLFTTPYLISDNTAIQWPVGTTTTSWCTNTTTGWYFASKVGTDDSGTESYIYEVVFPTWYVTTPTATRIKTLGEQEVWAMTFYGTVLYVGTNPDGWLYKFIPAQWSWERFGNVPKIDEFGKNYIDSMTNYNGKIVMSYQKWPGVYAFDPDGSSQALDLFYVLCEVPLVAESINNRIFLLNTGKGLLINILDNPNIYSYDKEWTSDESYLESSIYGWFIPNMQKAWIYNYIRITNGIKNDGSKVMFEVSFDQGETWQFCPTKVGLGFTTTQNWNDPNYSRGYIPTATPFDNEQLIFFYPYNTNYPTLTYRVHLKKWSTSRTRVNHVGCHFTLNNKQELFINYNFQISPAQQLLDGLSMSKYNQNELMAFLKDTWQNQDMCLITHVDGKQYHAIPFSDDRTPGQWLIVVTQNSNKARADIENLDYLVTFTFKTVANYDSIL